MEELTTEKILDLHLTDLRFQLLKSGQQGDPKIQDELLEAIKRDNITGFYQYLVAENLLPFDSVLLQNMQNENKKRLETLEENIEDAKKNLGETEVREALLAKANYLYLIGKREEASLAYAATAGKTVALGQKLDITFNLVRMGFFFNDHDMVKKNIQKARSLMEEGSDWDRRNRLKTYEAMEALCMRKMEKASKLLIETQSTFTSYEIFDFETFIFYTVISSLVSLDRVSLYKKVICSPEVKSYISKIPGLDSFLNDYYNGEYKQYFKSLLLIMDRISNDRILAAHSKWLCREFRIKAYSQFLESYRSVQMSSMANYFGISVYFLDSELSKFISSGRLNCKIDKIGGIIETKRPDNKNQQYEQIIKQGDILLNRVQKLVSRVINL